MYSLRASMTNEMIKILVRRKTIFFLILAVLLPIASAVVLDEFQGGFGLASIEAGDLPLRVLGLFTTFIIPLIVFMTAADLFAGEAGDGTMKLALTRPAARIQVFAAKNAALLITICGYLAVALVVSLASALLLDGRAGWFEGSIQAALAYGVSVLPLLVIGLAAVLLTQLFRNSTGALAVLIVLYVLSKLFVLLVPALNIYSPTAYTDWYTLWVGGGVDFGKLAGIFSFLTACGILCFTAGYVLFDRKEY